MDVDGVDSTSELSSLPSESEQESVQKAPTRTSRTSTRQKVANGRQPPKSAAARTSELPKRKQQRGKANGATRVDDDSADIAVPALDENGNFPQQYIDYDEDEDSSGEDDDDEQDEDFLGANTSRRGPSQSRGRGRGRGAASTSNGGGRATATAVRGKAARKEANTKGKGRQQDGDEEEDDDAAAPADVEAAKGRDDFYIEADNDLFNSVRDPRSAIAATVEDWLEIYRADEDSRGQALADLVNFVLRSCGCNLSVDRHEAQDLDGVVSKLDDIQTDFAKVNQASYPLIARSKAYKKFRASLQEFFGKLVEATAVSEVLYDDVFCETFQSWLVALSSSKLRAFRHTSTLVTLMFMEALCEISVSTQSDFSQLQRQREAEVKRSAGVVGKTTRGGSTDKTRLKELEALVKATHSNRMRLETYFKEIFDAVFMHRYRDAEAIIRMECIRSLGVWMSTLPEYFLEGNYLRYIGWMLTDIDKSVRREALASLSALYEKEGYIGSMHHFTERFKARLVEMATSDSDLNIRVEAIQVLRQVDGHGLLEDDQRDTVARLVFDAEPRVRRAASVFFASLLEDEAKDRLADYNVFGRRDGSTQLPEEQLDKMVRWKTIAGLLVKYNEQLEADMASQLEALRKPSGEAEDEDEEPSSNVESAFSRARRDKERADAKLRKGSGATSTAQLTAILQGQSKDRIALTVESLFYEVPIIKDWQGLLDYLLLDHSSVRANQEGNETNRNRTRTDNADTPQLATALQLEEQEESLLLDVLVASLRTLRYRASLMAPSADEERDEIQTSTTRGLAAALPRLFAKHQTDARRCASLLLLPKEMNLEMYLTMRQVSGYEQLWDDVTRQFVSHSDLYVIDRAMEAIEVLKATSALAATNSEKANALHASIVTSLSLIMGSIDAVNATPLEEEAIQKVTSWLARLVLVLKYSDLTKLLDEVPSEGSTSISEVASQIVERGQMGFAEEEKMIQQSLEVLYFSYLWKTATVPHSEEPTPPSLVEERNNLIEQCRNFAIGDLNVASQGVKRTAFRVLLDLHIAARARYGVSEDENDLLTIGIQTQYRCSGFVQAEIERYAALFTGSAEADELVDENEDAVEDELVEERANNETLFKPVTLAQHAATYAFNDLIVAFSRAICSDVLDIHHSSTVLSHYGRFGPFYNECCRILGGALRQQGILGGAGDAAVGVALESMKTALDAYVSHTVKTETCFVTLSRHLGNHLIMRGRGFAIAARLPSDDLVRLHNDLITYAFKKVADLHDKGKSNSRNRALIVFKGLIWCLSGMVGREAAQIHAHMDKLMKENDIDNIINGKHLEAQVAYDKRLVGFMSKDTSIKVAARRTVKKRKEVGPDATAAGEEDDEENDGTQLPGRTKAKPKAKSIQKTAAAPRAKQRTTAAVERPARPPTRRSNRAGEHTKRSKYTEADTDADLTGSDTGTVGESSPQQRKQVSKSNSVNKRARNDHEEDEDDQQNNEDQQRSLAKRVARDDINDVTSNNNNEDDEDDDLPPPLRARGNNTTASAASIHLSDRIGSPGPSRFPGLEIPVMDLSTQELDDTESLSGLPDSPPGMDESDEELPPRKKR